MLKYIYTVTEDLLIPSTLICLLYAFCQMVWKEKSRIFLWAGIGVGAAASIAMAIVKNTTRLVYTNQWNMVIFIATIIATVLFVLFSVLFGRREKPGLTAGGKLTCAMAAIATALLIFYELPDVLAYPFFFDTGGNGIISVNFLVRLIGWLLALILLFVYTKYLYRCVVALGSAGLTLIVLNLGLFANGVRCLGQAFRPWLTRGKWLPVFLPVYNKADFPWVFPFSRFVANNTLFFTIIVAGLALLIPLALFLRNLRVKSPYDNPAQLRKLKSICRKNRRRAATVAACFVLSILSLTAAKAFDTQVIELSAPEEYAIADGNVLIPLSQVEDGVLHRFEYTSGNGVAIRWIIIKKPGTTAYGVGLDACEVCGDAGYYDRNGQVICKRCDVVMNINTIGFKGGCNPIPLEYSIADGQIVIPLDAVIAGEKEFK